MILIIMAIINVMVAAANTFAALASYPEEIRALNAAVAVFCFGLALIIKPNN